MNIKNERAHFRWTKLCHPIVRARVSAIFMCAHTHAFQLCNSCSSCCCSAYTRITRACLSAGRVLCIFYAAFLCSTVGVSGNKTRTETRGGVGLTGAEIGVASGKQHEHHQCCCGRKYKSSAHKRGAHTHTRTHWRAHARIHSLVRSL